jgi:hypothetical protein
MSPSSSYRHGRSARSKQQQRRRDEEAEPHPQWQQPPRQQQQQLPQRQQHNRKPPEQSTQSLPPPGPEYALSFAIPKSKVAKETTGETHTLNFGNDWYNDDDMERQQQAKMDLETSLTMENTVFRRPSWERNDDDKSYNSRSMDGGNSVAFTRSIASSTAEFETLTLPDEYADDASRFSSVAGHSSMGGHSSIGGHSSLQFAPSVTSAAPTVKQSNRSFQRPLFLKKRATTAAAAARKGRPPRPIPLPTTPFVPPAPLSTAARTEPTVAKTATMESVPPVAAITTSPMTTPTGSSRPLVLAISALGSRPTLPIPHNPPFPRAAAASSSFVTAASTNTTTTTTTPGSRQATDQSRRPHRGGPAHHAMDVGDIPMKATSVRSLSSAAQSHPPPPPPPPSLSHHSTHSTMAASKTKPWPTSTAAAASMNLDLPNAYLDEDEYSRRNSNPYDMEVASAKSGMTARQSNSAGLQCASRRMLRLGLLGCVLVLLGVVVAVVLVLPRTKSQSTVLSNNAPSPFAAVVPINVSSHNATLVHAPMGTAATTPTRMPPLAPTVAPSQTASPTATMRTFAPPAPVVVVVGTATARTAAGHHDRD